LYQPGNVVQDPAPMNRPNINATPVDYFDYDFIVGFFSRPVAIITTIKAFISERSVGTQLCILECADIGC
jgi:hypothetical protein